MSPATRRSRPGYAWRTPEAPHRGAHGRVRAYGRRVRRTRPVRTPARAPAAPAPPGCAPRAGRGRRPPFVGTRGSTAAHAGPVQGSAREHGAAAGAPTRVPVANRRTAGADRPPSPLAQGPAHPRSARGTSRPLGTRTGRTQPSTNAMTSAPAPEPALRRCAHACAASCGAPAAGSCSRDTRRARVAPRARSSSRVPERPATGFRNPLCSAATRE